jgi:hypothetical protein
MVTQNFYDALKSAAQSAVCAYLDNAEKARDWLGDRSGVYLGDPSQYWKPVLCDEDPATASNPAPGPGFTGGQCAGVEYRLQWRNAQGIIFTDTLFGPIGQYSISSVPTLPSGFNRYTFTGSGFTSGGAPQTITQETSQAPSQEPVEKLPLERVDGLPDDCGDPPPLPPQPFPPGGDPLPTPPPVTYDDPDGNPITIAPEFTVFAPIVIGPNVFAPVRVDLPDVTFDGTLELSPEFNLELNPPSFDGSPGDSPEPVSPEDPTTSPDTPDDDENQKLLGAFVRSQETGYNRQTQIDQDDSPTLVVARLARLYFRVRMGGRLGWIGGYDVQSTNQYFPVPPGVYAIRAQAEWEGGWSGEVIPVFGLPDSTAL